MSNQSISSSEFQRFQDQLISLKEAKYKTEEKCEYLIRNISKLESKCAQLERELSKANDLKNKFKSAKDMDMLMNENQILRDRLSTIEVNFKLQNDVIRAECENLFSENERLKSQMETYKDIQNTSDKRHNDIDIGDEMDSSSTQDHQYKIRYLQHEVTKLLEEKTKIENDNNSLKHDLTTLKQSEDELASRINCLLNEKNKLATQFSTIKEELELNNSNHSLQVENANIQFDKQIELQEKECEDKLLLLKNELEEEHSTKIHLKCNEFEEKINQLQIAWDKKEIQYSSTITEITEANECLKKENEDNTLELVSNYEKRLAEKELEMDNITERYQADIEELKNANSKLQSSLDYTEEELKLSTRKNQKMLKDVRKQLEKEVKLTQETQSKLEEVVSSGSQNSQTKINEYLVGVNYKMSNADDQSSLYSSSNNGLILDLQQTSSNSIAMTDDELKNLLDRFTNVQNDLCESKRYIEAICNDKNELIKTIEKQQNIIFNYIKNRGGNNTDNGIDSPNHNHSTSEALILNGMMSSSQISSFGLQSLVNQVKESLRTISSSDSFPFGDKNMCRVTTAELKQLQRVCEELTMRCLNLETDLQLALDLNIKLNAQLRDV